jgi:uncharacterized protein (DUF952 family)
MGKDHANHFMQNIIYHITTRGEWDKANKNGFYEAASLPTEGFIHCSSAHQVAGVLKRYFNGKGPLVKLTIDAERLISRCQYDYSPSLNETFPHIYGRINLESVIRVEDI